MQEIEWKFGPGAHFYIHKILNGVKKSDDKKYICPPFCPP